jgi:hypothetical protein
MARLACATLASFTPVSAMAKAPPSSVRMATASSLPAVRRGHSRVTEELSGERPFRTCLLTTSLIHPE